MFQTFSIYPKKALPQENLKIEGSEVQYDVNDKINLSCKSGDGRPLPDLSWFINDNMVRTLVSHLSEIAIYQSVLNNSTNLILF